MKRHSLAQAVPAHALRSLPAIVIGLATLLLAGRSLHAEPLPPTPHAPTAVMIQLADQPAAAVYAAQRQAVAAELAHSSANGQAPNRAPAEAEQAATTAAQAQIATVTSAQASLQQRLALLDTPVLYTVQRVYNGVAVLADESQQQAIAQLPGVIAVHPLIPKVPANSASIPYLGVPELWRGAGEQVPGIRGEGMRIAIIDTGIDYLHRDFDGPGSGYIENDRTRIGDVKGFPGTRVVGGYDFVGDDYDASSGSSGTQATPRPDPDPMDCYGHGTHVAGTAAGSGVTEDRRTYTGPYTDVSFDTLHIGPGVAPRADIYALKIFGCYGSTNVTELALEWSVDPNRDGDFGDRMDVVNMSLGSAYAWPYDTSAVAADNAAQAGVIVVASAGNSGDVQFITSAPASADRAISVAATQHVNDSVASFSSRGPRRTDSTIKPDLAAPGSGIVSAYNGSGSERASSSGTSMAAPHVAGLMALLRQLHPDWSVEELKALAMNTAMPLVGRDTGLHAPAFLPVRTGAGRIAPVDAASATSVLYAAGGSGRVGLSFGAPAVNGIYVGVQEIELANKSIVPEAFDLTYSSLVGLPGVQIEAPQTRVQVPPGATVRVPITLTVDAAAYERRQAPIDINAYLVDNWLAEEGGHLLAWPPPEPVSVPMRPISGENAIAGSAAAPLVSAKFAYHAPQQTLRYTITLSGLDATKVTSATLGYGRETDESERVADLFPQLQAANTLTGSLVLDNQAERQLAAGSLHLRMAGTPFPGGEVRGQLLFREPVLHLPVYAAPRPIAQMHAEPQALNFMTDTAGTIRLDGQSLQGNAPPTEVVSLASVFELKLRSPNTRPSWLDPNGADRFDHADVRYIGVTSDLAQAVRTVDEPPQPGKDPLLYFGVATWAPWTTPSEVRVNVWLDADEDGEYEYRLANSSPIAAIFGMGSSGPLTSELYDAASGQPLAQQPLNGIWPERYDSNPFFSSIMVLPVRLADLELPRKGGRIRFFVQTSSLDTAGSGVRYVDQTPVMQYDVSQPALTFSPPGAAAPLYADQPGTEIDVAFDAVGHSYSPASGVLILHHHNDGLAQATAITIEARPPFRLFMPIVREQAAP